MGAPYARAQSRRNGRGVCAVSVAPTRAVRAPGRCALRRRRALEERAVALQGDAQVLGRDVLAVAPPLLEALALGGEALGESLHAHTSAAGRGMGRRSSTQRAAARAARRVSVNTG